MSDDPGARPVDDPTAGERASSADTNAAAPLTFPDLPRLELDQLLTQLVDRANEVMGTQGRLRGLLHANQMIVGHLALPVVLRRIAEAARELIGARYAALGVIAPDGYLSEFIHVGMEPGTVERIGRLPQGKGLLGALDRRTAGDQAGLHRRRPPLVRIPEEPPADDELPRGARSWSATRCSGTST